MPSYLNLDRFIVEILGDAKSDDQQSINKAKKRIQNRLSCGTLPRNIFKKFGRKLYVDLDIFNQYMRNQ